MYGTGHGLGRTLIGLAAAWAMTLGACSSAPVDTASADEGIRSGVGVTDDAITLGFITDQSGSAKELYSAWGGGFEAYMAHVNDDFGGVAGRRVALEIADGKYDRAESVARYLDMRDRILMLGFLAGTPATDALKDWVAEDRVLTMPGSLSSAWAREALLVLALPAYRAEVANAVDRVAKGLGRPDAKVAIVSAVGPYGEDGLKGFREAVAENPGLRVVAEATYDSKTTDFAPIARQLAASGADHVFLVTVPSSTKAIIEAAAGIGYVPTYVGASPSFTKSMLAGSARDLLTQHLLVSQSVTAWGEDVPAMAEMIEAAQRYRPEVGAEEYFVTGWVQARIVHQILQRAADSGDLTREGVIEAFTSIGEIDLGGLAPNPTYGLLPDQRVPNLQTRMFRISPDDPAYPAAMVPVTPFQASAAAEKAGA